MYTKRMNILSEEKVTGDIRAAFALPALSLYRSRYAMLDAVCEMLEEAELITNEPADPSVPQNMSLPVVYPPRRLNKIEFGLYTTTMIARRSFRYDVIHDFFQNMIPSFVISKFIPHRPALISSVYASSIEWFAESMYAHYRNRAYNRLQLMNLILEKSELALADGVITVTHHMKDSLIRNLGLGSETITVIPSEVDTGFFHPAHVEGTGFRAPNLESPLVLYVGNIFRLKGVFELVEAFSLLRRAKPGAKLCFAGRVRSEDESDLHHLIHDLSLDDSVEFKGQLTPEQVRTEYWMAEVLVLPTRYEGSPRVVKEACSCGCPVVGSRHPGILSIDPEGDFLTYVDHTSPESIANGILDVVTSESRWRQLSVRSTAKMEEAYSPKVVASNVVRFYHEVLSRK